MRMGEKRQYMGLMIERGLWGYYVFDWDYEGDGPTLAVCKTLHEAERFIERHSL